MELAQLFSETYDVLLLCKCNVAYARKIDDRLYVTYYRLYKCEMGRTLQRISFSTNHCMLLCIVALLTGEQGCEIISFPRENGTNAWPRSCFNSSFI